jgi:cytochrome bd-type quinol oxidase subunit 2
MFKFLGGEGVLGDGGINSFIASIATPLNYVMVAVLAVVALGAIAFAIYVAFRLAKAEDDAKRKDAKQQLLWSIIAVVATIGIFVLITTVFSDGMFGDHARAIEDPENGPIVQAANLLLGGIFQGFNALLSLATTAAMLFAVYIGFKLATAESDDARKKAKNQLLWTVIAIAAAIVLVVVINEVVWNVLIPVVTG